MRGAKGKFGAVLHYRTFFLWTRTDMQYKPFEVIAWVSRAMDAKAKEDTRKGKETGWWVGSPFPVAPFVCRIPNEKLWRQMKGASGKAKVRG